jgi:DNA-binding XRE family transcriptional regulator
MSSLLVVGVSMLHASQLSVKRKMTHHMQQFPLTARRAPCYPFAMSTKHPLLRYRQDRGMSLADIARMVNASRSQINRVERYETAPSMSLVARLIEASRGKLKASDFLPPRQN